MQRGEDRGIQSRKGVEYTGLCLFLIRPPLSVQNMYYCAFEFLFICLFLFLLIPNQDSDWVNATKTFVCSLFITLFIHSFINTNKKICCPVRPGQSAYIFGPYPVRPVGLLWTHQAQVDIENSNMTTQNALLE